MKVPGFSAPSATDIGASPMAEASNLQIAPENLLMAAAATRQTLGGLKGRSDADLQPNKKKRKVKVIG